MFLHGILQGRLGENEVVLQRVTAKYEKEEERRKGSSVEACAAK